MLYTSSWQQHPRYHSEILNLCMIQFWGRKWFLLRCARATSVWRRKVKCTQYSSVKPSEGNRSLCSSLPTEPMATQNLLPLLVTWATEIRNCFQEHKIGCCLICSCVQWEEERLQRPWIWVSLEPSLGVPTAALELKRDCTVCTDTVFIFSRYSHLHV